jgi:predicted cupin superfamily sugar epimerase
LHSNLSPNFSRFQFSKLNLFAEVFNSNQAQQIPPFKLGHNSVEKNHKNSLHQLWQFLTAEPLKSQINCLVAFGSVQFLDVRLQAQHKNSSQAHINIPQTSCLQSASTKDVLK